MTWGTDVQVERPPWLSSHRNGPTATVTVAFQGHYSRFVDVAPG
jgi:replicative DNA helicase